MRSIRRCITIISFASMTVAFPALAEDIDLYTGSTTGGAPNVLIVLDNSANWSSTINSNPPDDAIATCGSNDAKTYYCAQKVALIRLLEAKDANGDYLLKPSVGIGLMLFNDTTNSDKGGYIRFGVRPMNDANRAALIALLGKNAGTGLQISNDTSNGQENYGVLMWEAFKYFGGGSGTVSQTGYGPVPSVAGLASVARDFSGNPSPRSAASAGAGDPFGLNSASTNSNVVRYNPPVSDECGQNYIVAMSHNDSQNDNNSSNAATWFNNVNGQTSASRVMAGNKEVDASFGDEAAKFLFNTDVNPNMSDVQNVITYTIAQYDGSPNGTQRAMVNLMKSMAAQGGGSYYHASSIDELYKAFSDIVTEIQAINSVFVSPALPVSANIQGTFLNQVFIGMFRPDPDGSPKWLGNMKQYNLKYDAATNSLRLGDADGRDAIDGSGQVSVLARSFWTSTTSPNFWSNWVTNGQTKSATDNPDGPEVQKGGAAQRLRETYRTSQTARKVYTCPLDSSGNGACVAGTSLTDTTYNFTMNAGNTAPTFSTYAAAKLAPAFNLPSTTDADIKDLINWVRGTDNLSNESGPGSPTTVRPTIHADVLHSRPLALNYAGRIVVYYASNDGMLHALEGKQTGTNAGEELWAFTAPELLNRLERLRKQTPKVQLPSSTADTTYNKSYFMDGPIGAYQEGTTAVIYVAARRGGNFIYAFDVSDPDNPKYKFKISPSTTNMSGLGQTWSLPKVTKIRDGTSSRVVLIFGGGYDIAEDVDSAGTTGRGVYVVDALTGVMLKQFLTTPVAEGPESIVSSVPSEVTIVNTDRDAGGLTDRAYVGDLAGNVWRMDLDDGSTSNDPSGWTLHKLAALGARKFFFPPDVVIGSAFDAVLIGSGDREKPLATSSADKFYMLKDMALGFSGAGQATIGESDLLQITTSVAQSTDLGPKKGWYYPLASGEKVVNAPITIGGVVYYGTNKPISQLACRANVGQARSYAVDFFSGAGTRPPGQGTLDDAFSEVLGPLTGLPPSPVAGLVDVGGGVVVPFCIGCGDRRSALEASVPDIDPTPVRKKIHWKFKSDK